MVQDPPGYQGNLLRHHTGKDPTRGPRGSTVLPAGVDFQIILVEKLPDPEDTETVWPEDHKILAHYTVTGVKDAEGGKHIYLEAERVKLPDDKDTDGYPVTDQSSLVVHGRSAAYYDQMAISFRKKEGAQEKDDPIYQAVLTVLAEQSEKRHPVNDRGKVPFWILKRAGGLANRSVNEAKFKAAMDRALVERIFIKLDNRSGKNPRRAGLYKVPTTNEERLASHDNGDDDLDDMVGVTWKERKEERANQANAAEAAD